MANSKQIEPRDLALAEKFIAKPLMGLIKAKYFTLRIKGIENVPLTGNVVFVGNHSGWMPMDAIFLGFSLWQELGPDHIPYIFAHEKMVSFAPTQQLFRHLGTLPVSWLRNPRTLPEDIRSYCLFPEGADGNCKPFWKAYHMEEWKTGFVRLAIHRQAQVVPVAIMGSEEATPVAATLDFFRPLLGSVAPLPLFNFPLPSRWKIVFHEPLDFSIFDTAIARDRQRCQAIAQCTRSVVEEMLEKETAGRPLAWLAKLAEGFGKRSTRE